MFKVQDYTFSEDPRDSGFYSHEIFTLEIAQSVSNLLKWSECRKWKF